MIRSKITGVLLPLFVCLGCSSGNIPAITDSEPTVTSSPSQLASDDALPINGNNESGLIISIQPGTELGSDVATMADSTAIANDDSIGANNTTVTLDSTQTSDGATNQNTPSTSHSTTSSAMQNSDWIAPDGCIGAVGSDGTQYCVYTETRLFVATKIDGSPWWSFVLPGDNAINEIEAVFVFGDQVGLLADKMPGNNNLGEFPSKVNPYEVSLFEQTGAFIRTVPLFLDFDEHLYADDIVGHQLGEEPAQVVVTGDAANPSLLLGWTRTIRPSSESLSIEGVLTRYELDTGLAVAQYASSGRWVNIQQDPYFDNDVIYENRFDTVRLNGTSLELSNNSITPNTTDAATYTRMTNRVFELNWPTQFFEKADDGEITYRVITYTGFQNYLAPETSNNHVLFSLDLYPLPDSGGLALGPVQVHRLINGEPDGSVLYLVSPPIDRNAKPCEPACDLVKDEAAVNLALNNSDRGENLLTWSWDNNNEIEHTLIYRSGDLIGVTTDSFYADRLSHPEQSDVYSVIGVNTQGSETLPSSVVSHAISETPLTQRLTADLVTSEFVEAMANHSVGATIISRNENTTGCDDTQKQLIFYDTSYVDSERYYFDCGINSGVSSGVRGFKQPVPWQGHFSTWHSNVSSYTNFRFRDDINNELNFTDGVISIGYGGGGQMDQECIGDWESSLTKRNSYEISSMTVLGNGHDWKIADAVGNVYQDTRSTREFNAAGKVKGCVRTVSLGAESSFELTDTVFGIELTVESSILFYLDNPPPNASEEHYTIKATRANGDVIEINYAAIGAVTALVTYPQNGNQITVEIPTAGAPFPEHLSQL